MKKQFIILFIVFSVAFVGCISRRDTARLEGFQQEYEQRISVIEDTLEEYHEYIRALREKYDEILLHYVYVYNQMEERL